MDYETLDTIADSYTPLLALIALFATVLVPSESLMRLRSTLPRLLVLIILLGTAYALMFIDAAFGLWASIDWDYSTHTAVALVLILYLHLLLPKLKALWWSSLIAYGALMLYQQYHTIADMVSTAMAVSLSLLLSYQVVALIEKSTNTPLLNRVAAAFPVFPAHR